MKRMCTAAFLALWLALTGGAAAQEANIPFWTFVQTCSFNSGRRIPTEADILWQVNTALAYGAKGIQYFT